MKLVLKIVFLFIFFTAFSQEKIAPSPFVAVDSLYREDQFYVGLTYNNLEKIPQDYSKKGLSFGVNLGFLRDMPINKKRTFAIAAGFGFSYNKYHSNLKISENNGEMLYQIVSTDSYSRNKLEQVFVELPIEIRWRNSTPTSTVFFRIYSGFKVSYLLYNKSKYVGDSDIAFINNPDFNKLQYGPYLSIGYNTWNLHAYYALNPIFKTATFDGQNIDMRAINIGLIFYVL
jgi:Outer membrane protein beta-barrel domain